MSCEHVVIIDEGEHVCRDCGEIMHKILDEGAEWRNYEDGKGEDNSRSGFAISELLPDSSYGSMMSTRGLNGSSGFIKSIQRLSSWSMSSNGQRSWMGIFDAINMSCTSAGLPKSIIQDACAMYKNLEDAQKVRGETRRAMMGGAVFVACRNNGASRSHEEISKIFAVNIRALCKAIGCYIPSENSVLQTQTGIAERLCAALSLNDDQRQKVMDLLLEISLKSEDDFEHTPKTIVAGVVAHIMGLRTKVQMKEVASASGVSALSIHRLVGKI
jgi:transcription initiation factor TFIIB